MKRLRLAAVAAAGVCVLVAGWLLLDPMRKEGKLGAPRPLADASRADPSSSVSARATESGTKRTDRSDSPSAAVQATIGELIESMRRARLANDAAGAEKARSELSRQLADERTALGLVVRAYVAGICDPGAAPHLADLRRILAESPTSYGDELVRSAAREAPLIADVGDEATRRRAADDLLGFAQIKSQTTESLSAFDYLFGKKESRFELLQIAFLRTIGKMKIQRYVPEVWTLFEHHELTSVRLAAAETLAALGDLRIVGAVVDVAAKFESTDERLHLLRALVNLADFRFAYDVLREVGVNSKIITKTDLFALYSQLVAEHRSEWSEVASFFEHRLAQETDYEVRNCTLCSLGQLASQLSDTELKASGLAERIKPLLERGDMENLRDQTEVAAAGIAFLHMERDVDAVIATVKDLLARDERRAEGLIGNLSLLVNRAKDPSSRDSVRVKVVDLLRPILAGKVTSTRRQALFAAKTMSAVELTPEITAIAEDDQDAATRDQARATLDAIARVVAQGTPK